MSRFWNMSYDCAGRGNLFCFFVKFALTLPFQNVMVGLAKSKLPSLPTPERRHSIQCGNIYVYLVATYWRQFLLVCLRIWTALTFKDPFDITVVYAQDITVDHLGLKLVLTLSMCSSGFCPWIINSKLEYDWSEKCVNHLKLKNAEWK